MVPTISGILILAGTAVMAASLLRFRSIPHQLKAFSFEAQRSFWRLFHFHKFLMLFFIIGYMAVFVSIFKRIEFAGVLFVGVIFFFGALFVYLGILLQQKMLSMIKSSYQEAVIVGKELDQEKSNLLLFNQKLNKEIQIRQQVEDKLRESREQLKAIWDSISAGILIIDVESHNIIDANPSALSMIGLSKEKVLDNICHCFVCPAELGSCPVTDKDEKIDKSERKLLTTTGEQVPILKTVTEISVKGKKHLLETFIDITQLKSVEQKLKEACQLAECSSRAKSEFLSNMSHELRTPLNHIIGFSEMIYDQHIGELNQEQKEFVNNVIESGRHLLSLVNDILDLSKVEAGKLELEQSQIDFKNILQNSLVMVKEKAMKNGLQLSLDVNGIPDEVTADERRLKQILYNLLSNAVKFTNTGGKVELSANLSKSADYIEVSVSDTGIGLKSNEITRIFEPFEQAEGSHGGKYQGTGLGLSLTKKLVELHGGHIRAESKGIDQGSRFSFSIPVMTL